MTTWGEMSDEEQGTLLLAHHRGEVIEGIDPSNDNDVWEVAGGHLCDLWLGWIAYRVKKEPVVDVRTDVAHIGTGVTEFIVYAECTYTDGKLTKVHWEAEDAD